MQLESIEALERRLQRIPADAAYAHERLDCLFLLAHRCRDVEQWERMRAFGQEARQLAESAGETNGVALASAFDGFYYYMRANYQAAIAACAEGLRLASVDSEAAATIRVLLAMVHWTLGNFQAGLSEVDRALDMIAALPAEWFGAGFANTIRGGILHSLGEYEERAISTATQSFMRSPIRWASRERCQVSAAPIRHWGIKTARWNATSRVSRLPGGFRIS